MIQGNNNAAPHAIVSSRPSYRPRRLVIRVAIGHAPQPSSPYRFPSPRGFPSTPRQSSPIRHSFSSRSSSRSISSRRASRSYIGSSIHAVFVIPPSRVLLIGSYSPPSHHPAVEHGIAIAQSTLLYISIYIHRILVSLYLYIFHIHRIHHIHYIHQSTRHDEPHADTQASIPPSRLLVPPPQIGKAARGKSDVAGNKKQATMSQTGTPHDQMPRSHMMTRSRREHR